MFFFYTWPAMAWIAVIFILCVIPGNELPPMDFWNIDKAGHALIFGILGVLMLYGFSRQQRFVFLKKNPVWVIIIFCAVYGAGLELIQEYFIYKRTGSFFDLVADTAGAMIVIFLRPFMGERR